MSPKELTKLAAACRKAGITYYKQGDIEFTLGQGTQPRVVKGAPKQTAYTPDPISEETLTEEELLYWSASEIPGKEEKAS